MTEEKRAKYAEKNLIPESASSALDAESFLSGDKAKKALDTIVEMANRNYIWLAPKGYYDRSLSYHYKVSSDKKTDEYDIAIEEDVLTDRDEFIGTTYESILHALVEKLNDEDGRKQIKFNSFDSNDLILICFHPSSSLNLATRAWRMLS